MPVFNYEPYHNPYVQSMSALIQAQGQAQAEGALRSGQVWGNAIQGIGQEIGQIPQQIQAQKMKALQMQDIQGQIAERNALAAERQQTLAAAQAGSVAIKNSMDPATGKVDHEKAAAAWEAAGFPTQANAYRESVQKTAQTAQALTEGQQKIAAGNAQVQQASTNHLGELGAAGIQKLDAGATPIEARDYTLGLIANAASHGLIKEDQANQMVMQAAQAGPDQLRAVYQKMLDAAPTVKSRLVKEGLEKAETAKNLAEANKQPTPKSYQKSSVLLDGKPAEILTDPTPGGKVYDLNGGVIENAASRVKPIPSASAVSISSQSLSQAALDQAAQKYLDSGILPSGMGMGAQRTAIQNRAAEIDPKATLARNTAVFKADSANLTKLQTTEGALSAFENAAGKNIKTFVDLTAKLPDTGVPWLNTPIRLLNDKLVGAEWMPAVNAARKIALREVARVTNDPGLRGQLTDTARKEVEDMASGNATIAQMKRVFPVLLGDMANVHSGLNEQIATVKAGIGSNPNAPAAAPVPDLYQQYLNRNKK